MRTHWLVGAGIVAVTLLLLRPSGAVPGEQPTAAAEKKQKPAEARKLPAEFDALNGGSRKMYAATRTQVLASIPVVIVVSGDDLVLRKKGTRTVVTVIPADYHALKCIAHTTVGLFAHLSVEPDRPLNEERLKALKDYQALLTATEPAVEKFGFDADALARQKRILARAQKLTATVLADGKVSGDELTKFCRASREDVVANARDAARAQLLGTHKQVLEWKKDMTAEEWATLTVVIPTTAPARAENTPVQYFARLFGETNGESRRVVCAESLWDEEAAVNLLGTLRVDGKLGVAMFGDGFRMYRDFMADGARVAIDDILAPK